MSLLAIDLGLKAGLALFADDGRILWYRSHNYGNRARMKREAARLLRTTQGLTHLVLEGNGHLAELWTREAARAGVSVRVINAQQWRQAFLPGKHRRTGQGAKQSAMVLARKVITWSGAKTPTSLRHDAAEAILTGLWGVLDAGLLPALPPELKY